MGVFHHIQQYFLMNFFTVFFSFWPLKIMTYLICTFFQRLGHRPLIRMGVVMEGLRTSDSSGLESGCTAHFPWYICTTVLSLKETEKSRGKTRT